MSTGIGILAIAFEWRGLRAQRLDAYGANPQFGNYVESVYPANLLTFEAQGNFAKIDTTDSDAVVIAAPTITLPDGVTEKFSYFLVDPWHTGMKTWPYHILPVHKGEFGWVGLYYGALVLPQPHWLEPAGLNIEMLAEKMLSRMRETREFAKEKEELDLAAR
jgi:hypothetical protein